MARKNKSVTKKSKSTKFSYEPKLIKTPAFTAAFTKTLGEPDEDGKRSLLMCFEDDTNLKALEKECKRVASECFDEKIVKKKSFTLPVHEVDEDRSDDYEFLQAFTHTANAATWKNIPIVDRMKKRLDELDEDEFGDEVYAGCKMKAMVFAAPYDFEGNKGVALRIASLIKLADGERIAGGISSNTDDDFSDEFDEDVDFGDDEDDEDEAPKTKKKKRGKKKSEPTLEDAEDAYAGLNRKQKKAALEEFEVDDVEELDGDELQEFIDYCKEQ